MLKRSDLYFQYPSNLKVLDLATLVSLYRSRGEPYKVPAGDIVACSMTRRLLKISKRWFGLHYSQKAWDSMLTTGSDGYPMTEAEMNILGLFHSPPVEDIDREFVENNCGITSQMAFLVVNDLKQYGFLEGDSEGHFTVSSRGLRALDGIARRIYDKKFKPDMLIYNRERSIQESGDSGKSTKQIPLF